VGGRVDEVKGPKKQRPLTKTNSIFPRTLYLSEAFLWKNFNREAQKEKRNKSRPAGITDHAHQKQPIKSKQKPGPKKKRLVKGKAQLQQGKKNEVVSFPKSVGE